jgi:anti-sigma regulatory factor (Ser/Thr protein kinase)
VTNERQTTNGATVTLTVPSHPRFLYVVRSVLYPLALEAGFAKKGARQIVLAVDEACSNIIRHAYEGDTTKQIVVTVTDGADRFTIRLRDQGKKVDREKIAPRDLDQVRPGGLGTHFMNEVFDLVTYDTSPAEGTILILEKRKQQVNV